MKGHRPALEVVGDPPGRFELGLLDDVGGVHAGADLSVESQLDDLAQEAAVQGQQLVQRRSVAGADLLQQSLGFFGGRPVGVHANALRSCRCPVILHFYGGLSDGAAPRLRSRGTLVTFTSCRIPPRVIRPPVVARVPFPGPTAGCSRIADYGLEMTSGKGRLIDVTPCPFEVPKRGLEPPLPVRELAPEASA